MSSTLALRRTWIGIAAAALALFAALTGTDRVGANGVPTRIPLSYLAGLSTWGPAEARGEAEISFAEASVKLDVRGLPALTNETYQAWLVKSATNKATPIGTFISEDSAGGFTGKLTGLEGYDYDLLIVTVEPLADADPAPSTKRAVGGFFTAIKKQEAAEGIISDTQPGALPSTGDQVLPRDGVSRHTLALMLFALGGASAYLAIRRKVTR